MAFSFSKVNLVQMTMPRWQRLWNHPLNILLHEDDLVECDPILKFLIECICGDVHRMVKCIVDINGLEEKALGCWINRYSATGLSWILEMIGGGLEQQ